MDYTMKLALKKPKHQHDKTKGRHLKCSTYNRTISTVKKFHDKMGDSRT